MATPASSRSSSPSSRRRPFEYGQLGISIEVHIIQVDGNDGAIVVLAHECEVEHADEAAVDKVDQEREGLTCRLFPGRPLDDEVVDGTKLDL